jgi:uncharacterized protein YndB with AHSA1/START domain
MIPGVLFVLLVAAGGPAPQVEHLGPVTVTRIATPQRQLVFEVRVPASRDSVWAAFTTGGGLSTWLWGECTVDLRQGGGWTAHYPGGKTGGTIERVEAGRSLTLHAKAPEQFPTMRRVGTTALFAFAAVGDTATDVRLTQTGWRSGKEWDAAYEYLAQGNAQLLGQLHQRFVHGPIDWAALGHRDTTGAGH